MIKVDKYVLFMNDGYKNIYYSVRKDFESYDKDMKFFDTLGNARRARCYIYKYDIADKSEKVQIRKVTITVELKEIK